MKVIVLKCGGSVADELNDNFFDSIIELRKNGYGVALVHGGGPDITGFLKEKGIESRFVDGLRYTDEPVLSAVELMLSGKTNRQIVKKLKEKGIPAIGLQGSDQCFTAEFIDEERYGLVGNITGVNTDLLTFVLEKGLVPVVTPLAETLDGTHINVNADSAAATAAIALNAEELMFVTNVRGILNQGAVIERTTEPEIDALIASEVITGGMIPKVKGALKALHSGVGVVRIVSGQEAVFSDGSFSGTAITKEGV